MGSCFLKNIVAGSAVAALLLISTNASAQFSSLTGGEQTCNLKPYFLQLQALQSTASSTPPDLEVELKIRKDLLRTAVRCASDEALLLQSKIRIISTTDQSIQQIQNYLVAQLDAALAYYTTSDLRINRLDIEGSKSVAKTLLEWRRTTFAQLSDEVVNFLIWFANQDLFKAAEKRLSQLSQTIIDFRLTEDRDVLVLLQKAKLSFGEAQGSNRDARFSFRSDQSSNTIIFIKSSLEHLAEAYQRFLELNQLVKNKILSQ